MKLLQVLPTQAVTITAITTTIQSTSGLVVILVLCNNSTSTNNNCCISSLLPQWEAIYSVISHEHDNKK